MLNRIRNGTWPEGGLIPTEAELAAEFGCARATNRALQALAQSGVLERRRKVGTRVVSHPRVQVVQAAAPRDRGGRQGLWLCAARLQPAAAARRHCPGHAAAQRRVFAAHPFALYRRWRALLLRRTLANDFATPGISREALEQISPCEWISGPCAGQPEQYGDGGNAGGRRVRLGCDVPCAASAGALLMSGMDWLDNGLADAQLLLPKNTG